MKILVSGYYGFNNVGDEAVLEAMVQGFRESAPNLEITVLSARSALSRELAGVEVVGRYDFPRIIEAMQSCDVFLSGGGSLIQDASSSRSLWYYLGLIGLAKLLKKKVMIFAQGLGPLQGRCNRRLTKMILNSADLITLRDRDSLNLLSALGVKRPPVEVTADPTLIFQPPLAAEGKKILSLEGINQDKPILGIALRNSRLDEAELAKTIDESVRQNGWQPVFLLFQTPEDLQATSRVIKQMSCPASIVYRLLAPQEMLAVIGQCRFLIGMRLHALIFAALAGVPAQGLADDPKIESFMKQAKQPLADLRDKAALNFKLFFDHFGFQTKGAAA